MQRDVTCESYSNNVCQQQMPFSSSVLSVLCPNQTTAADTSGAFPYILCLSLILFGSARQTLCHWELHCHHNKATWLKVRLKLLTVKKKSEYPRARLGTTCGLKQATGMQISGLGEWQWKSPKGSAPSGVLEYLHYEVMTLVISINFLGRINPQESRESPKESGVYIVIEISGQHIFPLQHWHVSSLHVKSRALLLNIYLYMNVSLNVWNCFSAHFPQ